MLANPQLRYGDRMRRREFISVIGSGAIAWPFASSAQQSAMPMIGFLNGGAADAFKDRIAGFHRGLAEAGYLIGKNVAVDYQWAEGQYDRLPELVAGLVQRGVAVISATGGDVVALAAKRGTSTIPVVFVIGGNPVALGLATSFARPGGNFTGISLISAELGAKRLELILQLVPDAASLAVLINPASPSAEFDRRGALDAARVIGQRVDIHGASSEGELEAVFLELTRHRTAAVVVSTDAFFYSRRQQLIALARRHRIPTVYYDRVFALDGGLISYGASIADAYRQNGLYTAKILQGAKPADLPIQQPTKFELVINLKTAKAIGITMPPSLLVRADEVIE